jgi:hypothetical protein
VAGLGVAGLGVAGLGVASLILMRLAPGMTGTSGVHSRRKPGSTSAQRMIDGAWWEAALCV